MNLLHANDVAGQYPPSYYAETRADLAPFAALAGDVTADVGIVGGGYTGLSAALHLAQRGYKVAVLEAHRVGFGASGRNGGQVGSGQRQDQDWLESAIGKDKARALWDLAQEANALVRSLIANHAMPVTFYPGVAHACRSAGEVRASHAYADKLRRDYGYMEIEPLDRAGMTALIPSGVFAGGEIDHGAGHLHPLNYAIGLARAAVSAGAVIYEGSEVIRVVPGHRPVLQTATGRVICDHVVLAGNGYLGDISPPIAAKVMPINNFIVATEPLGARAAQVLTRNVAVADSRFVVSYWRLSEDGRLLFGGGESYGYRFPDIVRAVRGPMLRAYPDLADVRIDHAWGGTLAITMNRLPCFSRPAPGVYSASGYSGHGVAMASLAGKLIAEALAGTAERFDLMAGLPQARFPGGTALRLPLLALAMRWYALRDRLGV